MVKRRWFGIVNKEIKTLSVKLPEEDNQEFLNLIERFPNLKNVEINPCFSKRLQYLLPSIWVEEGKNPKIVNGLSQSLFSRYFN